MCSEEKWTSGSVTAVIVAVIVALNGWEALSAGAVDALINLPLFLNGAPVCLEFICVRI